MNNLHRLFAVAIAEWKLQIRTIVFWVGLAVLLVYTLASVIRIPPEMAFLSIRWLGVRDESLTWIAIVLVFLVPSSLARDRRSGVFIHTTPVTGSVYAGGKLLGVWLTALTLGGSELAAQFLGLSPAWKALTPEAVSMILTSVKGWLIGILYIAAFYFLITALTRGRAFLAYTLNIVYFIVSFSIHDVANPFTFIPSSVFRSDLVGNGPESSLFSTHDMLYLSLTVMVSILALLVYPWREKRSLFPRIEKTILLFGFILALSVVSWSGSAFAEARARALAITGLPPHSLSVLSAEDVRSVRVNAHFEPKKGRIEGRVELAFAQALEEVMLYIPAGLELSAVTDCHAQELQATYLGEEWATIAFTPQMCIAFEGAWRANRAAYRADIKGYDEFQLNVGAYIGQGYVYLTPVARWYPAPVGSYEWGTIHEVHITAPHAMPSLVAPEALSQSNSEWTRYEWNAHHGRPPITLVVGDYQTVTLPGDAIVWASPEHQHVALQAADFFLGFLKPVERFVRSDIPVYQVIETPVLRWPIVSGQVVLLPERYFLERLSTALPTAYERDIAFLGPQQAFQQEAYRVVRGWLFGQASFADTSLIGDPVATPNPSLDPFSGFVPLRESLAHYLSLQALDQKFATRRLDEVMEARMKYSDEYLHNPELRQRGGGINADLPVPPYERNWAFNQMFAAIGRLERRVGREQVNRMIGLLFERHHGSAITTADWLEIINEVAGPEARQEFETTCLGEVLQLP